MRIILDTNQVVWAIAAPHLVKAEARHLIEDVSNEILLSFVCIWEVAIKRGLGRADFDVEPSLLLVAAKRMGLRDLPLRASAAIRVAGLPSVHRDPLDRVLVAQAMDEDAVLLTADRTLLTYGPNIRLVA